jgi:hypothetical protein
MLLLAGQRPGKIGVTSAFYISGPTTWQNNVYLDVRQSATDKSPAAMPPG